MDREEITREAIRLNRRYQREIVEALHLCPWAERARMQGEVLEKVLLEETPDAAATEQVIDILSAQPGVTIGLLLFPCLRIERMDFYHFVSQVSQTEARAGKGHDNSFAMAAFHPNAIADAGDPDRLVPFIRRTPDPTIQLVRRSALDKVRQGFNEGTQFVDIHALATLDWTAEDTLSLRDRIARTNHRTILRAGVEAVAARLDSIFRDRDRTYARLGLRRG